MKKNTQQIFIIIKTHSAVSKCEKKYIKDAPFFTDKQRVCLLGKNGNHNANANFFFYY